MGKQTLRRERGQKREHYDRNEQCGACNQCKCRWGQKLFSQWELLCPLKTLADASGIGDACGSWAALFKVLEVCKREQSRTERNTQRGRPQDRHAVILIVTLVSADEQPRGPMIEASRVGQNLQFEVIGT